MALGLTQALTEISTRNISWGGGGRVRRPVRITNNLNVLIVLIPYLGASTSWNPQGLSRPVMGLLYFYIREYERSS